MGGSNSKIDEYFNVAKTPVDSESKNELIIYTCKTCHREFSFVDWDDKKDFEFKLIRDHVPCNRTYNVVREEKRYIERSSERSWKNRTRTIHGITLCLYCGTDCSELKVEEHLKICDRRDEELKSLLLRCISYGVHVPIVKGKVDREELNENIRQFISKENAPAGGFQIHSLAPRVIYVQASSQCVTPEEEPPPYE